jgi:hypothetical protein
MSYYLRFEAVNLSNFIADTNDLSTIRGGGLLLLDATEKAKELIAKELGNKPQTITQGASWALFELETDETGALQIKQKLIDRLNSKTEDCGKENPLRHATFVVDVLEKTAQFVKDRDCVHTLNRWQQMQSLTLAIPQPANDVCAFDKVRPGTEGAYSKSGQAIILSPSVDLRRKYGISQKRSDFYKTRTNLDCKFTQDLDDLSCDRNQGILNGKIAVIYIDGNKFGQVVRSCKDSKEQAQFDGKLREGQNAILKALLQKARKPNNVGWRNNDAIRLETLLWGGDELIWVVPAWLGWKTLDLFFKQADEHIKIDKKLLERSEYTSESKKLTHAAGLVFCHHNAPIHRITALARSLAEIPKKQDEYKYKNMVAYQILESFDHAGTDIEQYRQKRLVNLSQPEHLLIPAEKMEAMEKHVNTLKTQDFPRRKSYQIIKALLAGDSQQAKSLQEKLFPDNLETLEKLKTLCGGENAHWLHLTDLWDYLALEGNDHD